jgi:hypothetical protein
MSEWMRDFVIAEEMLTNVWTSGVHLFRLAEHNSSMWIRYEATRCIRINPALDYDLLEAPTFISPKQGILCNSRANMISIAALINNLEPDGDGGCDEQVLHL